MITINGKERQICSRCIYDETVSGISFDEEGVCNYCHTMERFQRDYGTGTEKGEKMLADIIAQIKKDGKGKKYDCVVGVSGGTDSSYLVVKLVEWGLRPLAVHYDNTWNSEIAEKNMKKVLDKLNVDLYTYTLDAKEQDDIMLAFLKAGVPEVDAATDIALIEVLSSVAAKHNIKYMIEGHSYTTEGISPLSNMYMDGKYVQSIHKMYGKLPLKTYPLLSFSHFMKWTLIKRVKRIRPLWYINYSKEEAREMLQREFGWEYYGGHHLENKIAAFQHSYHNYVKFGMDNRNLSLAAGVRSGLLDREWAINEYYNGKPYIEDDLLIYVKKRLNLTDEEFGEIMNLPNRRYTEFPTYKKRFKRLKPLFYILMKCNLVAESFYIKYTS